ncbi:MAG TPA: ABC transporter permease [Pelobium sp.]|nr:ABC transporter permease [Pelobium sp.]
MSNNNELNSKKSWQVFAKNKLSLIGLFFIGIISVSAFLGYWLTPDDSPMANDMHLELNIEKPGSTFTFIKLPKHPQPAKVNLFGRLLYGQATRFDLIPVANYRFQQDYLLYQGYLGPNERSEWKQIKLSRFDGKTQAQIQKENMTTKTFWLGTDIYGRDLLSRIIIGARVSLTVGFMAVLISLVLGISLGATAGFFGGKVDATISWLMNVLWSLPALLLVIAISFALGKGFWQVFIAVGLSMWVEVARLVRGQVLALKNTEFVEAARSLGFSNLRIIYIHILPNIMGAILVMAASNFASAILLEAGLSFLGFGAQPPMPTWGGMIKEHYGYIVMNGAYLALIPGLMIMLTVYAFNLITIGLRDLFDLKAENTNV